MTIFTYARVSSPDQNTDSQAAALKADYPDATHRQEKKSGTSTKGREMLALLLDVIEPGDKLVVWKIDRLARNTGDLCRIVDTLKDKALLWKSWTRRSTLPLRRAGPGLSPDVGCFCRV